MTLREMIAMLHGLVVFVMTFAWRLSNHTSAKCLCEAMRDFHVPIKVTWVQKKKGLKQTWQKEPS